MGWNGVIDRLNMAINPRRTKKELEEMVELLAEEVSEWCQIETLGPQMRFVRLNLSQDFRTVIDSISSRITHYDSLSSSSSSSSSSVPS